MKKFLTVLLALSVVFTYTVGTAFAAVTPDAKSTATETVKKVADKALSEIGYANGYVASFGGEVASETGKTVSTTAVNQAAADLWTEITTSINTAADDSALAAVVAAYDSTPEYLTVLFDGASADVASYDKVLVKQAAIDKAAALTKLNAVNSAAYYDYNVSATSGSDKAAVEALVATAKATINGLSGVAADVAAIKTALALVFTDDGDIVGVKTIAKIGTELSEAKTVAVTAINTAKTAFKAAEILRPASAEELLLLTDANLAAIAKIFADNVNAVTVDENTTLAAAISAIGTAKSAADTAFTGGSSAQFYAMAKELGGVAYMKQYAITKAASVKAERAPDGTIKYYTETVDEALKAVNVEIDNLKVKTFGAVDDAFTSLLAGKTKAELDAAANAYKPTAKAALKAGEYAPIKWDGERSLKVEAIREDAEKAIDAATTIVAMDKIVKDAKAEMDKFLRITDISKLEGFVDAQYASAYASLVDAHIDNLINTNGATNYDAAAQKAAIALKVKDYFYGLVTAKEDATLSRTDVNGIMAANYAGALDLAAASLTTKATLESAEKALIDKIDALDATTTDANKDKALAVYEDYLAYKDIPGSADYKITNLTSKLTPAVSEAVKLVRAAIEKVQDSLLAKVSLTMADKATVDALKADIKAFNKDYADYPGFSELAYMTSIDDKMDAAAYADAVDKIKAIPEEVTLADKATVDAAKAAFDALTDAQKKAMADEYKLKLNIAVETVAALEKANNKYLTEGVQNTKAKITSKSYKGKIVLKFSRTKGFKVDGYQLYKSTKKSSGFKSIGKTTKTSYTNTKNLVKGKRYYYKVRGYRVIGGKTVYTKFSGVVYRTAK